jgi:hypothetical protein
VFEREQGISLKTTLTRRGVMVEKEEVEKVLDGRRFFVANDVPPSRSEVCQLLVSCGAEVLSNYAEEQCIVIAKEGDAGNESIRSAGKTLYSTELVFKAVLRWEFRIG